MSKLNVYCSLFLRKYKKIKKTKIKSLIQENEYLTKILDKVSYMKINEQTINKIKTKINRNITIINQSNENMNKALKIICSKINPYIYDEVIDEDLYFKAIELYLNNDNQIFEILNIVRNYDNKINKKALDESIEELKFELKFTKYESNDKSNLQKLLNEIEINETSLNEN